MRIARLTRKDRSQHRGDLTQDAIARREEGRLPTRDFGSSTSSPHFVG
jgi:hypothetical protein